jgi:hypothetical protein
MNDVSRFCIREDGADEIRRNGLPCYAMTISHTEILLPFESRAFRTPQVSSRAVRICSENAD